MGKKSSAKQQTKKAKAAATKADAPAGSESPSNAPTAAPSSSDSTPTSWLDSLTPQERQIEEAKVKKRKEQAEAAEKKAAWESFKSQEYAKQQVKEAMAKEKEDRKWEHRIKTVKKRAGDEGILEAEDWGDTWWVNLGGSPEQWIQAQGQYYCSLCSKNLNDNTLEAHMESEAHKKKVAWNMPGAVQATMPPPPSAAPPPRPAASSGGYPSCPPCNAWPTPVLEDWQEMGADGCIRCIPCGKVISEGHLAKADHVNRLESWRWKQNMEKTGYPAPEEPYIAWMPFNEDDITGERYRKCLLCNKWLQDDSSHSGTRDAPQGSKDHQKYLRNYGPGDHWYEMQVVAVRNKWHPNSTPAAARAPTQAASRPLQATAAPWAKASAAAPASRAQPTPAPWAKAAPAGLAPVPAVAPSPTPKAPAEKWVAVYDPGSNSDYYYHAVTRETSWTLPPGAIVVHAAATQEVAQANIDQEADPEQEVEC